MQANKLNSILLLVAAAALLAPVAAQTVVSTRTETRQVTAVPIQAGTRMSAVVERSADIPGAQTYTEETLITVLGFQIPDFDPEELRTRFWHVGMFSDSGNGSGTLYPDDTGYAEFERSSRVGETPMQTFLYSVHAETKEAQVFIDIDDLTVNKAVEVLNNLGINSDNRPVPGQAFGARMARRFSGPPPAIGDELHLGLYGDYLSVEDLQEQIFQQTRCNVERDDGVFYLAGCN